MKQVLIKQGQIVVDDVPAPMVHRGALLIQVSHSCISAGTEMSGLQSQSQPLWKRALKNPKSVKTTLEMVANQGFSHTRNVVGGKLAAGNPIGYSAAGTVLEVGDNVHDLQPGDRVACAGAQCAHHAEIICVPRNLSVPIPDSLPSDEASTVTLGAIAMQGLRRAQPTLGETFVVVGLGILGQITTQLLKANGCRVIGSDPISSRVEQARQSGMDLSLNPGDEDTIESVFRMTQGHGADGVIVTAATASDEVISQAFQMCRRKGRVVLVGDVGLNLKRGDFYPKEIDFFISTSYGPGRYDANYEEKGMDYPISYVRWTENRNMQEYLRLLDEKKVQIQSLIHTTYPVDKAPQAYADLKESKDNPLIMLLSYPSQKPTRNLQRKVRTPGPKPLSKGKINLAIVGAGGFSKGMHVPNLQSLDHLYTLAAVASRTGNNATNLAQQVKAQYATTDFQEILSDEKVDAVLICTRHHLHAEMTLQALKAGKHVLVEKPLALKREEMRSIQAWFEENPGNTSSPVLLTGFNRRFSPHLLKIQELTKNRTNPMIINYRMNAGHIPLDHWVHSEEGGGRNLGEACHIYDLFTFLTNSQVTSVQACSIKPSTDHYTGRDNFVATLTFNDGSVSTLTYTALGSNEHPKEQMEVFVDGKVFQLNDYRQLKSIGLKGNDFETKAIDKGHKNELMQFAKSIHEGSDWPIPLWQQFQATEIALRVDDLLVNPAT